jgi:hypothetical protein
LDDRHANLDAREAKKGSENTKEKEIEQEETERTEEKQLQNANCKMIIDKPDRLSSLFPPFPPVQNCMGIL